MQNRLEFQPHQSSSWACSWPQTHPCSQLGPEKMCCPHLATPVSHQSLPGPAPRGPEPGSQALGDFLTLSTQGATARDQCAGAWRKVMLPQP